MRRAARTPFARWREDEGAKPISTWPLPLGHDALDAGAKALVRANGPGGWKKNQAQSPVCWLWYLVYRSK